MTTSQDQRTEIAYERTVDRSLVHRHAVAEVYATDAVPLGDDRYLVGAQLPRRHTYYTDHTQPSDLPDPLLLLECVRQAATVVAHRWLGVSLDTSFLVTGWDSRLIIPDRTRLRDRPGQLRLLLTATDVVRRAGAVRSASYTVELELDGIAVGGGTVHAGYMNRARYRSYRELRLGAVPPSSGVRPAIRRGTPVPPVLVGRTDERNVVLVDGDWDVGEARAHLDVPVDHPVFYDHPLDHVPAMSLLEAACQAALLAVGPGPGGTVGRAVELGARFVDFVELEDPVLVRARAEPGTGPDRTVDIGFTQGGTEVCTVTVGVLTGEDGT